MLSSCLLTVYFRVFLKEKIFYKGKLPLWLKINAFFQLLNVFISSSYLYCYLVADEPNIRKRKDDKGLIKIEQKRWDCEQELEATDYSNIRYNYFIVYLKICVEWSKASQKSKNIYLLLVVVPFLCFTTIALNGTFSTYN